ncbi:VOC family protein [Nocardioides sp. L-11A]|uniref:VOC family protein n=1 Tax=Nocardioides sp. L-11A TaxID=3043848 RepID=UPI002499EE29|nr:VOC family protein [Nocardioides sp. L-11A]
MLTHTRLSSLFVLDQDEALDFYVGVLGMEVRTDADLGFMRWLTVGVPGDPDREILLERPGAPSMDDATAGQVRDLLTRGAAGGWIALATDDAQAMYDDLVAKGVDVTDEISVKGYGTDFGIRDPFGNRLRIGQMAG